MTPDGDNTPTPPVNAMIGGDVGQGRSPTRISLQRKRP